MTGHQAWDCIDLDRHRCGDALPGKRSLAALADAKLLEGGQLEVSWMCSRTLRRAYVEGPFEKGRTPQRAPLNRGASRRLSQTAGPGGPRAARPARLPASVA